jgi:hypothetical protein
MSARRVLVLGATGMLGRQLLAHRPLAGSKWSAVGLARRPAQEGDLALDLLACVNEETGAFVPPSDEIQKALEDVTDVVHCIGTLLDGSSAGYKRLLGKSLNEQPASTYERMNRDTGKFRLSFTLCTASIYQVGSHNTKSNFGYLARS